MNVAEILRRSNQASLDSLVPLTKIQTRTDMKRYAQNGTRTQKPKHWTLKPACIPIPPFGQKGHYIMTVGALAET